MVWFLIASVRGLSGTVFSASEGFSSSGAGEGVEGVDISSRSAASDFLEAGFVFGDFLVEEGGGRGFVTLLEEELGPKARVDWARVEVLRRVGGMVVVGVLKGRDTEGLGMWFWGLVGGGVLGGGVLCGCGEVGVNI